MSTSARPRPTPRWPPTWRCPIEEMDLTVRSYNCLKREGIHSIGELVGRSEADLLDIRNFGQKSIDEVKGKLAVMGLALKDSPPGFDPGVAVDSFGGRRGIPVVRRRLQRRRRHLVRRDRAALGSAEDHPDSQTQFSPPQFGSRRNTTMPTPTKGPRLGGSPAHQRLLLANLATALFEHGRIVTTEAKAKRLRPLAERLVTFAKRGDLHARRRVLTVVRDKSVVHTLFTEIGPRFENRNGGYTRITKLGPRKGDNAPMAQIELVEALTVGQQAVGEAERARGTRFAGRRAATGATVEAAQELASESPTAAAVAADEGADAEIADTEEALASDESGIPGEGGEVESPEVSDAEPTPVADEAETTAADVATEAGTDEPQAEGDH